MLICVPGSECFQVTLYLGLGLDGDVVTRLRAAGGGGGGCWPLYQVGQLGLVLVIYYPLHDVVLGKEELLR